MDVKSSKNARFFELFFSRFFALLAPAFVFDIYCLRVINVEKKYRLIYLKQMFVLIC